MDGRYEGEWFGIDKLLHAGVCFVLVLIGHVIFPSEIHRFVRFFVITNSVFAAGFMKELFDLTRYGGFSRRDLIANSVGILLAHAVYIAAIKLDLWD